MRLLPMVLCLIACYVFRVSADHIPQFDVQYRDYLGHHQVKGIKKGKETFLFNPKAKNILTLATLDWPPYIDKEICKQGWVLQSTVALLHHIGYGAVITFYPWARAIKLVEAGKADILFPEYYIGPEAPSDVFSGTRRLDHLVLTESFGWGPIAFMSRKGYDMSHYINLNSLVNEHIGVVRGYQNTPEFDRMMDMGSFKIIEAVDDMHNVKLLINHRVNLIIGDPLVIEADIRKADMPADEKKSMLDNIQVVEPIMHMNGLFFAISRQSKHVEKLTIQLNQAIDTFKKQGIFSEIQYKVKRSCEQVQG